MLKNKTFVYLILAVTLSLLTFLFFQYKYSLAGPVFLYLSYLMFAGLSILGHNMMKAATDKKESYSFVNTYLGITAVKMFVILAVLTIYLFFVKSHLFVVGIFYALAYLLFLVADVSVLLSMLKSQNKHS